MCCVSSGEGGECAATAVPEAAPAPRETREGKVGLPRSLGAALKYESYASAAPWPGLFGPLCLFGEGRSTFEPWRDREASVVPLHACDRGGLFCPRELLWSPTFVESREAPKWANVSFIFFFLLRFYDSFLSSHPLSSEELFLPSLMQLILFLLPALASPLPPPQRSPSF